MTDHQQECIIGQDTEGNYCLSCEKYVKEEDVCPVCGKDLVSL